MSDAEKPSSEYVLIRSSDNFNFIIPRSVANASGTLANLFDESSDFSEAKDGICSLQFRAILAKVFEYLTWKLQWAGSTAKDPIPDFSERIEPEIALELLMAADYLDA